MPVAAGVDCDGGAGGQEEREAGPEAVDGPAVQVRHQQQRRRAASVVACVSTPTRTYARAETLRSAKRLRVE